MNVKQLYTNCLAQGAYYVSDNGEAAIIDPLRETKPYLDMLQQNNDKLLYIFETHFHADFVSGHVDLAQATNAKIVFGPQATTSYQSYVATNNEEFKIGRLTIKVLHTPGHTLESTTYLLLDEAKKPMCIFSGDTLFIGDVGRPDLAIKSNVTQEDLAGMLYDSLRNKIMPLPDDVMVYPGHGAGSACGKNMSKETFDTLGSQKKLNYALREVSKSDFIKELTEGILPAPQYFAKNAALNKNGYQNYDAILESGSRKLSVDEFEQRMHQPDVLILDVRTPQEFAAAHIPNALYIGLDGQFAPWVGTVIINLTTPILIVAPKGREEEAVMRLSRVGYDNCLGCLADGMEAWLASGKKTESVKSVAASDFYELYQTNAATTLDVRRPGEYSASHLKHSLSKPLDFVFDWIENLDKTAPYLIHCAGGYRSMITASLLKQRGYHHLIDVQGGFGAISKLPHAANELVSETVCSG